MRSNPVTLLQAILVHSACSAELGPVIWAAFKEVEGFFRRSSERQGLTFQRYYLASDLPPGLESEANIKLKVVREKLDERFWGAAETRGLYDGTFEQGPLVEQARRLIGGDRNEDPLVVVTDVELSTVPKDLFQRRPPSPPTHRYRFFSKYQQYSFIISIAPMDPEFWEQSDANRIETIKRRARAACCRTTCELLGIGYCRTSGCFMQIPIENPQTLDRMNCLCAEHPQASDLQGYGFPPKGDPNRVQDPVKIDITSQ
jgi:hypothetical protein